jgi:hypothetical protein
MPRFIAFHPAPVSCWDKIYRCGTANASVTCAGKRPGDFSPVPELVNEELSNGRISAPEKRPEMLIFQSNTGENSPAVVGRQKPRANMPQF